MNSDGKHVNRSDLLAIFAEVYSNDAGLTADDIAVTVVVTTPDGDEVKQEVNR